MVVVSPGVQPKTRLQRLTQMESGSECFFYDTDVRDVEKRAFPIVLVYNGKNHYCPAICINRAEFRRWQLQQVSKMSVATVTLVNEVDMQQLPQEKLKALQDLEKQLRTTITALKEDPEPAGRTSRSLRSVLIAHTDEPAAPLAPGRPAPPPLAPARPVGRQLKYCDYPDCLYQTFRKADLEAHYWSKHDDDVKGIRIECMLEGCISEDGLTGKKMSTKNNLRLHKQHVHSGIYKFSCKVKDCGFQTEGKQLWEDHKEKHKKKKKSKKPTCNKCQKQFASKTGLNRHINRGACQLKKNFHCGKCGRWFKQRTGLQAHKALFHNPDNPLPKCTICQQTIKPGQTMENHLLKHRAADVLKQAKESRAQKEQKKKDRAERLSAYIKKGGIPKKKLLKPLPTDPSGKRSVDAEKRAEEEAEEDPQPMVQESVPAKLIPRRSGRAAKPKKK